MNNRCGECDNCEKVERTKRRVLAVANPPFSHATDGAVDLWNQTLKDFPCQKETNAEASSDQH